MKMLFIVDSLKAGGAGRVISELANFFSNDNKVYIVFFNHNEIRYQVKDDIEIINANNYIHKKKKRFLKEFSYLRNLIKKEKFDLIISFLPRFNILSLLASMHLKVKNIISIRNDPNNSKVTIVEKLLSKILYRKANGIVFQTERIKNFYSKKIQLKSAVIPNPINPNIPLGMSKLNANKIIMAGRLNEQKNYYLAIDGFELFSKINSQYRLDIYGDGPLENDIRKYIEKKNLVDKIFLHESTNDIYNKMLESKIFLLTSDYEGMPNSLMEAMSIGLICISTKCGGGGPECLINNNENGFLINCNDPEQLCHILKDISENKFNLKKISYNATRIKKTHSLVSICTLWDEYFKKIK